MALALVLGANAAAQSADSPLAGTDWHFLAGGSALFTYDSNPFIQASNARSDSRFDLAPTIAAGLGDFRTEVQPYADIPHFLVRNEAADVPHRDLVYLRYTPDFQLWDRYHHNNTVNEDVQAEGRIVTDRIDASAVLRAQSVTSPDVDVGARIHQIYDTVDLRGQYALTGRTDVGAELYDYRSAYSGGLNSNDFGGKAYADYALANKTSVGLGLGAGTMTVHAGPSQSYWRPLVRWQYLPTGKLSFAGDAGVEFRHFQGGRSSRSTAVVDLSGSYAATASTTATLSFQRQTMASALYANEDMQADIVQASIRQRMFYEFYGTAAGGYARDSYYASALPAAFIPRRDDFGFVRFGAAHDLTTHGTVQISYEHRHNDSTDAGFGFAENLATVEASFLY